MLEMAVQGAAVDGVLPSVLPSEAHAYVVWAYNFVWVEGLVNCYELTTEKAFVNSCWPAL